MPFDINTVPAIRLISKEKNSAKIIKINNRVYNLFVDNKRQMMLDLHTNKEIKELYSSYDLGYGKILMSGLGFGILPLWLANKPGVEHIHIIEMSQDVVDMFLEKNVLPDNVTIQIDNINNIKTDEEYDCILLDHYELTAAEDQLLNMQYIAKNIPNHKLFWSWAMESVYMDLAIKKTFQELLYSNNDMSGKWGSFRSKTLRIPTVPALTPEKINEYIYTYADTLESQMC